jgi:hypothetical protein
VPDGNKLSAGPAGPTVQPPAPYGASALNLLGGISPWMADAWRIRHENETRSVVLTTDMDDTFGVSILKSAYMCPELAIL